MNNKTLINDIYCIIIKPVILIFTMLKQMLYRKIKQAGNSLKVYFSYIKSERSEKEDLVIFVWQNSLSVLLTQ